MNSCKSALGWNLPDFLVNLHKIEKPAATVINLSWVHMAPRMDLLSTDKDLATRNNKVTTEDVVGS